MTNEQFILLKLTCAALATLGLYSVLYKENKVFRFFEHAFLGLAGGYMIVSIWTDFLYDSWWMKMVGTAPEAGVDAINGYWLYAILVPLSLLGYFVFSRRHNWMSRILIGFLLGYGATQEFQAFWVRYGPQIARSMRPVWPTTTESFTVPSTVGLTDPAQIAAINSHLYPSQALTNVITLITLLSVLSYFIFSVEVKSRFLNNFSKLGRWLLMVGFGAIFGSTVMMRFTLLIDRMNYVWIEWLRDGVFRALSG